MNKHYKKFITVNILVTFLIGAIGTILFLTILAEWYQPAMPIILAIALIINLVAFRMFLGREDASFNVMLAITKSFGLKFLSYIGLVVILLLVEKNKAHIISLVIVIFTLYIVYTILEVKAFSEYAKEVKK